MQGSERQRRERKKRIGDWKKVNGIMERKRVRNGVNLDKVGLM